MKWEQHSRIQPTDGAFREVTKFIWFPKTLCGKGRWLTFSKVEQRYTVDHYTDGWDSWTTAGWIDYQFID